MLFLYLVFGIHIISWEFFMDILRNVDFLIMGFLLQIKIKIK
ncbi:hypothetical protein PROVRETT_08625 [Providencia rettgeri DSM 1131]|nr:hypothetical protein PROVRETT_08625 [Providencia rettgeri DSM 1131]